MVLTLAVTLSCYAQLLRSIVTLSVSFGFWRVRTWRCLCCALGMILINTVTLLGDPTLAARFTPLALIVECAMYIILVQADWRSGDGLTNIMNNGRPKYGTPVRSRLTNGRVLWVMVTAPQRHRGLWPVAADCGDE